MKHNAHAFNEVIFSRLFAIFAPGSAKVRAFEHAPYGRSILAPASRYIEGRKPDQSDFSEEALKHNGLASYLVTSVMFNSSDAKLANLKIDRHGRFAAFDFEEMLPNGTKDFTQKDFLSDNILTNPYLVHLDIHDHYDVEHLKKSPVFQEEIYKAMIKFIVFPQELLREEIKNLSGYSGLSRELGEDYFEQVSQRFALLQSVASEMEGFQDYLKSTLREELLATCMHDFNTTSCNGRYAQRIRPFEKVISEKLDALLDEQPRYSPRNGK